jgi:hypothetical protein
VVKLKRNVPVQIAAILFAAVGMTACAGSNTISSGDALVGAGPQTVGTLGVDEPRVEQIYRFAFPLLTNKSAAQVRLTGFSVIHVDPVIQINGYSVYSTTDVGDRLIIYTSIDGHIDNGVDMAKEPDYLAPGKPPMLLAPGAHSKYIAMVKVSVSKPVRREHDIDGCRVYYSIGNRRYRQDFTCEFSVGTNS